MAVAYVSVQKLNGAVLVEGVPLPPNGTLVKEFIRNIHNMSEQMVSKLVGPSGTLLSDNDVVENSGLRDGDVSTGIIGLPAEIVEQLKSKSRGERAECLKSLGQLGKASAFALSIAITDEDWEIQSGAVQELCKLAGGLPEDDAEVTSTVVAALTKALARQEDHVFKHALIALRGLGVAAAPAADVIAACLDCKVGDVSRLAVEALCAINGPAAVPGLLKALQHEKLHVQQPAGELLLSMGQIGPRATPAIPALARALPAVFAQEILLRLGKPAAPVLIDIVRDSEEDEEARNVSAELISKFDPRLALEGLTDALKETDLTVSRNVLQFLDMSCEDAVVPVKGALRLLKTGMLDARREAMAVLVKRVGALTKDDANVCPEGIVVLSWVINYELDIEIRALAEQALAQLREATS